MPRRSREDGPDALHHVYNRGLTGELPRARNLLWHTFGHGRGVVNCLVDWCAQPEHPAEDEFDERDGAADKAPKGESPN